MKGARHALLHQQHRPSSRPLVSDEEAVRVVLYGVFARVLTGGPTVSNVRPVDPLEIALRAAA